MINNYRYTTLLTILSTIITIGYASIPDLETARLKSTGGAGVGSILMDEATLLNPAPIAFYTVASLYYQTTSADMVNISKLGYFKKPPESDQVTFIASDAKGVLKGSISYQKYNYAFNHRERYAASLASTVSKNSSVGLTYRASKDKLSDDALNFTKDEYEQLIVGTTHVVSPSFTLGLLVIDPLQKRKADRNAILGAQYVYGGFLSIIVDLGADYKSNISKTSQYSAALQFRILSDLLLRIGSFRNRKLNTKGSGIGIGWVQPKLVFELSLKNTKDGNFRNDGKTQNIKETTFSASIRF